jgi:hypothetical protein
MEYKLGITSKKNKEILAFLKILSRDHAVSEFEANLRVVEHKLDDYLAQPDRPPVSDPEGVLALLDDFYVLLTKFENQLQELNRKGSLVRILNSNRLRRELEKMNSLLYEKFDVFYRRLQQSKQEAANDEIFPPDALRSQGRKGSANLNYNRTLAASCMYLFQCPLVFFFFLLNRLSPTVSLHVFFPPLVFLFYFVYFMGCMPS